MRTKPAIGAALLLLASCVKGIPPGPARELIFCGGDEVFILDITRASAPDKVWSWRAADRPELPEGLRKKFGSTDDCKPVDGCRRILITSSGGAVALVERESGKVLFYASVLNAHSAEILPGNRVLVASSYAEAGNRLLLFDLAVSDKVLASEELFGAHGVVWDRDAKTLWALGEKELRAYEIQGLESPTPKFSLQRKIDLPDPGGHDLRPVPGSRMLLVTAHKHVWFFDRDAWTFKSHPILGEEVDVKSVDIDPMSGRLCYTQAEEKWWTDKVRFASPEMWIRLPGLRLYKARWAGPRD